MFGYIRNILFGSNDSVDNNIVGNSDDVFHAILENIDGDSRYVTEFGEPRLVDRGGQFSTDYMVQIPTFTQQGDPEPPNIEYNLPDAEMGDTTHELFELLDYYNIDQVSDLGKLQGESIMATFENGTLSLRFDELQTEVAE